MLAGGQIEPSDIVGTGRPGDEKRRRYPVLYGLPLSEHCDCQGRLPIAPDR